MPKWCTIAIAVLMMGTVTAAPDVPKEILLWPNGAPGSEGKTAEEVGTPAGPERGFNTITNVHKPSILPYLPVKEKANGIAVVVFPGGGHRNLAIGHEGYNVGEWLAEHGIAAFVVKYRLAREPGSTYKIENEAMADTQRAIRLVRSRASEWNINPDAVGVMGFSAGGELAAMSSMKMEGGVEGASDSIDRLSAKPNFQALIYPGQSGNIQPSKDSPPAFLAAGSLDRRDISEGLAEVYLRFKRAGVPVELHLYGKTGHGFGVRPTNRPPAGEWTKQFEQWVMNLGLVKKP